MNASRLLKSGMKMVRLLQVQQHTALLDVDANNMHLTFEEIRVCIKALNSMQTARLHSLTLQNCSRDFGSEEFFEKLLAKFYEAHNEALEEWKESHPSLSSQKNV